MRTAQRDQGRKMMRAPPRNGGPAGTRRLEPVAVPTRRQARAARDVGDWELAARLSQVMVEHDTNYVGTHYATALVAQHAGNQPPRARG